MTGRDAAAALARSVASLTDGHDVVGAAAALCRECAHAVGADSVGVLLHAADGRLEPLAATSHAVQELELYQAQVGEGPCVDVVSSGAPVTASDVETICGRWPVMGDVLARAGYRSLHAAPLRWRGETVGALNVFRAAEGALGHDEQLLVRAFADVATLLVVHGDPAGTRLLDVVTGVREALDGRTVVERAKGVVAQVAGVSMEEAYEQLLARSRRRGVPLAEVAAGVLREAVRRPRG